MKVGMGRDGLGQEIRHAVLIAEAVVKSNPTRTWAIQAPPQIDQYR